MKILENHLSKRINTAIEEWLYEKCKVVNDKSASHVDFAQYIEVHFTEKSTRETFLKSLPWVQIAISNAKRNLLRNYLKINDKYLQLYLDEFCYKLNRSYFGDRLFDRLSIVMFDN